MGVGTLERAVFFDRDGVLNETSVRDGTPHPPRNIAELKIAAGAAEAVDSVRQAGYRPIIITNQPDIARNLQSRATVEAINYAVAEALGIKDVYMCAHDDVDRCSCRKPKPGLVLAAAREHHLDLHNSFVIGDRASDIACGRAAGCVTVFLDHSYGETLSDPRADYSARSLSDAMRSVLNHKGPAICSTN